MKKTKRKFINSSIAVFMSFVMLLVLSACGESNPDSSTSTSAASSDSTSTVTTTTATAATTTTTASTSTTVITTTVPPVPEFEEITLVDNEHCIIKITGIDPDNMWGYTLNAYFENKSKDTSYQFSIHGASVNGVQTDPFFGTEVLPGKKSNNEISFIDSALSDNDVGEYTDIELYFNVHDADDWLADPVVDESFHIYPLGKENTIIFEHKDDPQDTIILDNEYAKIIVTGYEIDDIWGYATNLCIINKTDVEIMVSVNDASINGYMMDPFFGCSVLPHALYYTSVYWSEESFEENKLTYKDIEEIEFNLRVTDVNDWMAAPYAEESILLNP